MLRRNGGNTLIKIKTVLMAHGMAKSKMTDIEEYIDDTEVFEITQEKGLINQTYRVNLPGESNQKFYNLVVQTKDDHSKITLIAYGLDDKYIDGYLQTGSLTGYTGTIAFDPVYISEGHPCDDGPNPDPKPITGGVGGSPGGASGGGSGGSSGGSSGGGGSLPYVPVTGHDPFDSDNPRPTIEPIKFNRLEVISIVVEIGPVKTIPIYPAAGGGASGGINLGGGPPPTRYAVRVGSAGIVSPDPCDDYEEIGILDPEKQFKNNCDELATFVSNVKNLKSLNDLKITSNNSYEDGFSYSISDPVALDKKGDLVIVPAGGKIYGASHDHPNPQTTDYVTMFSLSDIYRLGVIAQKNTILPKDYSKFIFTLTFKMSASTIETFAIKIENWNSFLNFLNIYTGKTEEELRSDARILGRRYTQSSDRSSSGYAKVLLKYMNEKNIAGVAIYKAQDADFQSWNKLTLDVESNILNEIPCK